MNEKTIALTFGRMNPPTIGHQKLIDKLLLVARVNKAQPQVYLSHTQDSKKNPLYYDEKIRFAREAFGSNIVFRSEAKTIFDVLSNLSRNSEIKNIIIVVGSDRVNDFEAMTNKYNNSELYSFDSIKVISAGTRDPDAEGVEGMSASKMRALAKQGKLQEFLAATPTKLSQQSKIQLYQAIRSNMGLNEQTDIDDDISFDELLAFINSQEYDMIEENVELLGERKALTIAQRIKRGRQMRKLQPKLKARRKLRRKMMATPERLVQRARKAAIMIIRKKLAGKKGADYANLSPAEKQNVDRLIEKSYGAVNRIAARLLPIIKRKEQQRVRDARSTTNEDVDITEIIKLSNFGWHGDKPQSFGPLIDRRFDEVKNLRHFDTLKGGYDLFISNTSRQSRSDHSSKTVYIMDSDVKNPYPIALVTLKDFAAKKAKTYQTSYTVTKESARGKGLMHATYASIIKKLGYNLVSDATQTTGSMKLWQQLAKTPGIFVYAIRSTKGNFDEVEYSEVKIEDVKLQGKSFVVYPQDNSNLDQKISEHEKNIQKLSKRLYSSEISDEQKAKIEDLLSAEKDKKNILLTKSYQLAHEYHKVLLMAVKGRRAKLSEQSDIETKHQKQQDNLKIQQAREKMREKIRQIKMKRRMTRRQASLSEQNEIGTDQTRIKYASMTPGQPTKLQSFVDYVKKPEIAKTAKEIVKENDAKIGKPFRLPQGSSKKFGVYVRTGNGKTKKVTFGDPNMEIKRDNPERRKSFRARHNCDNPGPKDKARYWSCKMW